MTEEISKRGLRKDPKKSTARPAMINRSDLCQNGQGYGKDQRSELKVVSWTNVPHTGDSLKIWVLSRVK